MKRPHKYRAVPTEVDGVRFDSKREAAVYAQLRLRERASEISGLELQPVFPLVIDGEPVRGLPAKNGRRGPPLSYTADFAYFDGQRRRVVDVKGMDTPVARLKRAIVQHIYKVEIEVVR